mmetsp:Transcript_24679/g.37509  ORF Transcript_24679/g.37509 Transcript_24679/m.37509 type:complete len:334 (+) Transcript_24679:99-1100(+)
MDTAQNGEVSTIFAVGFPHDAHPRELDNLCRFLPGFVQSNVSTTKGMTLFALFDTPDNATYAISMLDGNVFDRISPGEPMKVQMARNNMRTTVSQQAPPVGRTWGPDVRQPPPPTTPHPYGYDTGAPAAKRPRVVDPTVDTVASIGANEAGYDENALRAFFEAQPGYLEFKGNPRVGGGFAKFSSPQLAVQAMQTARNEGLPCDMAKSSMGAPAGAAAGAGLTPRTVAPYRALAAAPPAAGDAWGTKRPRIPEDPNQVDTIACVGARDAGFEESALHTYLSQLPGFMVFKPNPRMGGGFAKFSSAAAAVQAVQMAQEQGVPAAMAKSSMSVTA